MEHKLLLVTVAILFAVVVALLAGMLERTGGARLTAAIRTGAAAFAATLPLVILIMSAVGVV
ncbi:hypothetical protein SAZ11_20410 [Streptomyces sp. FXJ1.4098]|uniref:hypothetical protein n=1 Tax=Streptomyces sp. NPDC020845 TaxID=3365096 RepID=UPI002996ACAF|nr:hypothetical protein [Streptomyces sp. FXJ1.4098]